MQGTLAAVRADGEGAARELYRQHIGLDPTLRARPHHYPLVGQALVAALPGALGESFTDEHAACRIGVADPASF